MIEPSSERASERVSERAPEQAARPGKRSGAPWALVVAAIVLAALSAAFAAGYTVGDRPAPTLSPTPIPLDPAEDVAQRLGPSTVFIRAGDASGSGFVYDAKGLILTASHVVDDLDEVTVRLADGTALQGKVLGRDTARDVAVVQVKHEGLRAATLGRGLRLRPGQIAVAIGSPFGLKESVTAGVISGTGRTLETPGGAVDAIQTDASINVGNSGGPLADSEGRVIGINVAVTRAATGNIGLAVPIDVAFDAVPSLEKGEPAPKMAFLGVLGDDPAEAKNGALVVDVRQDSPAEEAGIKKGDVLLSIDGVEVPGMTEFAAEVRKHVPGERVEIVLQREEAKLTVTATLGTFEK